MGCVEGLIGESMQDCQDDEDGANTCFRGGIVPGECFESYAQRAPTTGDSGNHNVGDGIPDPNKITTPSIPVNCEYEAQAQMEISPGTEEEPAPLDVTWVWNSAPPGLNLDPHSGKVTGNLGGPGSHQVTVYARDEEGNELDQRTYQINAHDCSEGIQFQMPMQGTITSRFGPRRSPCGGCSKFHKGLDIANGGGTPIKAAADGVVIKTRTGSPSAGNYVVLGHNVGDKQVAVTRYLHLASYSVSNGQQVTAGQQIGVEGNTGVGTGPHLHFEIRDGKGQEAYDPEQYLNGAQVFDSNNVSDAIQGNPGAPSVDPGSPSGSSSTVNATNRIFPGSTERCSGIPVSDEPVPSNYDPTSGESGAISGNPCGGGECDGMTKEQVIQEINAELDNHPQLDAEDRQFILTTAKVESTYNPCAKNPSSSATGLYQMIDSTAANTWNSTYGTNYSKGNPPPCEERADVAKSTATMVKFYTSEIKPAWDSFQASGGTKIRGMRIADTAHSRRYKSLNKTQFCYGLIHHDGIGNAVKGIDKGGVSYISGRMRG